VKVETEESEVRPLEVLLIVAIVGAFLLLVFPLRGRLRWMRWSPLVLPAAMGAQMVVEGARWQMVPAYALSVLVVLVWLLREFTPARLPRARWARRIAAGSVVVLWILGLAVSVSPPVVVPVFRFSHPTGPYDVGTVTRHWVDTDRPEVFTADSDDHRELMAQIWYPTHARQSSARAAWVPDADALAPALARQMHLPGFVFSHFKYVRSNAIPDVPMAHDEPSYPVLIFLHGFAGFRQHNTFQVEELVSHGYIVTAIDQPYAAASVVFPGGRQVVGLPREQMSPLVRSSYAPVDTVPTLNGRPFRDGIVPYLAQDVSFTLDRLTALNGVDPGGILTGRLDLQRAGVFGPSLGGIVGAEACRVDPRLRACLAMDAPMPTDVVRSGLQQPTMWITREAATMRMEGWSQSEIDEHQNTMRAV